MVLLTMQVTAGMFRGKKLVEYFNNETRPTTGRVKENIFNVLTSMGCFSGKRPVVLDLFAGTGQMGIEAVSRGAREVVFNDIDPSAFAVINKNWSFIKTDCVYKVLNTEAFLCLEKIKGKMFDLVFIDAPYKDGTAAVKVSEFLRVNKMLSKGAVAVVETESDGLEFAGFDVRQKKYGRARVYFLQVRP